MRSSALIAAAVTTLIAAEARAQVAPPAPTAPTTATTPADAGLGIVFAFELGVGGVVSGGSDVHGPGLGRGFMLGIRRPGASIEWHFAGSYDAPVDDELAAANTAGTIGMSSVGVRIEPARNLSVYVGMAKATVPVLVLNDSGAATVDRIGGIGPTVGVELGKAVGRTMRVGVELRLAKMVVTDATDGQLLEVTGPPDADGMIPVMATDDDISPLIATLALTVKFTE